MDRLVDEAEALGGAVSSAIMSNNRLEPIPDQQLSLLNSITANDLTGKLKGKLEELSMTIGREMVTSCITSFSVF